MQEIRTLFEVTVVARITENHIKKFEDIQEKCRNAFAELAAFVMLSVFFTSAGRDCGKSYCHRWLRCMPYVVTGATSDEFQKPQLAQDRS